MLKLNRVFNENVDEQRMRSVEIVDQVNRTERRNPTPPEQSDVIIVVEESLFKSKYYEMAVQVYNNYGTYVDNSYYDRNDFVIKAERLAKFLKERKAIPIAKENLREGVMKSLIVFVDGSHGKEYGKNGRSAWICRRCSSAHVYFQDNVYCGTENHQCEPKLYETNPIIYLTPKVANKRGTRRPQSHSTASSHSKNASRDSLNSSSTKSRDNNASAGSLPTPLSSKPHQSNVPLQSNTAAKQSKSRAKKRSKPSSNATYADKFPFVPYAPRTKSIDSDIFESTSTMSQPIRHPDDSDIETMYGPRSKRTSSLPAIERHRSKTPEAETQAMEETLSVGPVHSPFFIPSADALKEACKELKIDFNFAAYEYWSIMKISFIPSKVVSFETYPNEHGDGFKLLSMMLTSSDNRDDSANLAINVNKKLYYHYKKYPEVELNEDPGEFLFSGKLTVHHLKFLSELLSCRIGIYAEDGTLIKYGDWNNGDDVMTILLSVKDERYALVTKVHG